MNFTNLFNPYAYAMQLRRYLYRKGMLRARSAAVPVISVGNLSMGGTGKTPVTLFLASYCFRTLNKKTAIVLRGYKRKSSGNLIVSDGKTILATVDASGDEAQLYAQEMPGLIVICDEDRIRGAQGAILLGAEVILLDDGFQHLRIKRDLNILLINSAEGIPPVLPFGKGREAESAMNDADIVIRTDPESDFQSAGGYHNKPIVLARTILKSITLASGEEVIGKPQARKILAVSGIAHPERFAKMIGESAVPFPLPDHVTYTSELVNQIISTAKAEHCDAIATTTKDAVKLLPLFQELLAKDASTPQLYVYHITMDFSVGKDLLLSKINELFKQ
ncbi:MAG: tetraacyldisaccharide 4'-kinase [Bacteroidota bacterium]|nr:tetraacyldisaccharide 4'-kinase [Bacteroidota bacterium]MDP4230186.1 tetraacyldisaccharide 4'-kinase [Bacteroidota bacterium]MDP4237003.1 tetraacyldisaccharide 4'-kinase [Bacteroidota bacterium]